MYEWGFHEIKKKKNLKAQDVQQPSQKTKKEKEKEKLLRKEINTKKKGKKMIISEKTKIANDEHIKKNNNK